jgi:hypothetical protein
MRPLTTDKIEVEMLRQAGLLRRALIDLGGGHDGFADIAVVFDGVATWQTYMSHSGEGQTLRPANIHEGRLVLNDGLQFVPLLVATPAVTLLTQNVGLHQSIIRELDPGTAVHLAVSKGGPLQLRSRFGPEKKDWDVPSDYRKPAKENTNTLIEREDHEFEPEIS